MRFEQDFIPSTRLVADVFLNRLMPAFASVEDEVESYKNELWQGIMSQPYYDDCPDQSQIAEAVQEASMERYLRLKGVEQGLVN